MEQTLHLWMLGPWRAQLDGGRSLLLPTRYARILLARLALAHPQPVARATLLSDLFPELPFESAHRRFRATRHYLRRALGNLLVSDNKQLALAPNLAIVCDYIEFERKTHPGASQAELDAAIALYRGPLLVPAPDGWAAYESHRAHMRYIDALRRFVALALASNTPAAMLQAAQRWVAEEPWEERAHIGYLQALIALGDRATASAHLNRARASLRSEWGHQSGPVLEELARAIARMPNESQSAGVVREVSVERGNTPLTYGSILADINNLPLIGRATERNVLNAAWRQATQGRPAGVLIEGASGVGKSRFVHDLAAQVRLRSHHLVFWWAARGIPPDSWLRMVENGFERLNETERVFATEACAAIDDRSWSVLCRYVPEIRRLAPQRAPAPLEALPRVAEATRRVAALHALIDSLASRGALLLIIDDLPLVDPELRQLLTQVLSGQRNVCLLVTCLPGTCQELLQLDPESPEPSCQALSLGPLGDDATRGLVRAILGGAADQSLIDRLVAFSGGSPSFVLNVIRNLLDQDALRYDARLGWQLTPPDIVLPLQINDLLTQRLSRLSPGARHLAALLAVLGRPAENALLETLWDDEDARLEAQAELLSHAVLVERVDWLRFDHPSLQSSMLASLTAEQRTVLHAQIAAALRTLPDADRAERMQHHAGAQEWAAALDDALAVAEESLAQTRLPLLRRALDVAEQSIIALGCNPLDDRRWPVLRLRERYHAQAERGPAWEHDLAALQQFAMASQRADWQVEALSRYGLAELELGRPAQAEGMLRQAAELARSADLYAAEAWARLSLANALDATGAVAAALQECLSAANVALAAEDTFLHLRILIRLGYAHARSGQMETALTLLSDLNDHPVVQQRPLLAVRLTYYLGVVRTGARDYNGGLAALRNCLHQAQVIGDAYWELLGQTSLCLVLARIGLFAEGRSLGEVTLPMARQIGDPRNLSTLLLSLAATLFYSGDAAEALPLALEGAEYAEQNGLPEDAAALLILAARIALALGRVGEAQALLAHSERLQPELLSAESASAAAAVWLALKRPEPARRFARIAIERALQPGLDAITASAALWEAAEVLATLDGRAETEPFFKQALERFLDDLSRLDAPELRRAFISARPAHRAMASAEERDLPRRMMVLPLFHAPAGRRLYADECTPIVWTVRAPDDPQHEVERRRRQIIRLTTEALAQGAVATVEALASTLAVTPRTIKRDLRVLRDSGVAVTTRGTVLRSGRQAQPSRDSSETEPATEICPHGPALVKDF